MSPNSAVGEVIVDGAARVVLKNRVESPSMEELARRNREPSQLPVRCCTVHALRSSRPKTYTHRPWATRLDLLWCSMTSQLRGKVHAPLPAARDSPQAPATCCWAASLISCLFHAHHSPTSRQFSSIASNQSLKSSQSFIHNHVESSSTSRWRRPRWRHRLLPVQIWR